MDWFEIVLAARALAEIYKILRKDRDDRRDDD
jgi:hypothetical protein